LFDQRGAAQPLSGGDDARLPGPPAKPLDPGPGGTLAGDGAAADTRGRAGHASQLDLRAPAALEEPYPGRARGPVLRVAARVSDRLSTGRDGAARGEYGDHPG